jgi:[ribosomal protein S5]-alanine N-acetyltransferase
MSFKSRVYLRRPSLDDAAEFAALCRASRAFHRNKVSPPASRASFAGYVARCERADFDGSFVCLRMTDAIVGVYNLSQIFRGNFRNAYLGYYVGKPYAGLGLMADGLELVLRRAFHTLRLHRLEANLQPSNHTSRALVERAGFRLEGFSPRYLKVGGRYRDHERWALTVEDYERRR